LQLAKLELSNWKCYREQAIEFNQDATRNISVVFGSNGFGKTSILEAIRWCLYGSDAQNGIAKNDLTSRFNRVAIRESKDTSLSIVLTFNAGTDIIVVSRFAKRVVNGSSTRIEVDEPNYILNGKTLTNPRDRIEALLPAASSQFYFFDGVEIKRYAQTVHSPEMRGAIERILGIPELRNLRDDAGKAMASIDQELSLVQAAKPEFQRVTDLLEERHDEQNVLADQLELAMTEHTAAQGILEALQAEANTQELLRTQLEEIERKKREAERLKRDIDEAEVSIEQGMRQMPIALLQPFVVDIASDLQRKSITSARRSGVSATLRQVLDKSVCVCGRELDDKSRSHIEAHLAPMAGSSITMKAMIEDDERNQLESLALSKQTDLTELLARRDRLADDLDGLEEELRTLRGERELPSLSLSELWRKVGDAEGNVRSRRESVASLRRDQEQLAVAIDKLRRERENLATRSAETAALGRQATMARNLWDAAKELIDWHIAATRATIEATTSRIHLAVTNKPLEYVGIEISADDYSLRVRSAAGDLLDPDTLSAGEKEALAFSFIAGLNVASGKSAPFVMDTPFGHLDINHQRNLVMALPTLPSQVTLLATDRDLPEPLLNEIRSNIADMLTISRVGATDDASIIRGD
jgi:DNA sulfur modification protein DndD